MPANESLALLKEGAPQHGPPRRSTRMSDVAELAGVSIMTVSRVLSGHPVVSEQVRTRVNAAVEQLHYQPNELARSLREQRSRQIGILVPYLFDPFFATCAHAISTVAQQHAYSVVLSTSNEDPDAEVDEANRMLRRNIEGLVVIPARVGKRPSRLLGHEFDRLPIVALDRPIEGGRFDGLTVENERGARIAIEHLISLGHKRIVFLSLSTELYTMRMREKGYLEAMKAAALPSRAIQLTSDLDDTRAELAKLLTGKAKPTALLCGNNLLTRHVLHSLQSFGIHPPEHVALVGFDDFDTADLLGITTVCQPEQDLGRTAAEMLFERLAYGIAARDLAPRHLELPVRFIVRTSCGAQL